MFRYVLTLWLGVTSVELVHNINIILWSVLFPDAATKMKQWMPTLTFIVFLSLGEISGKSGYYQVVRKCPASHLSEEHNALHLPCLGV